MAGAFAVSWGAGICKSIAGLPPLPRNLTRVPQDIQTGKCWHFAKQLDFSRFCVPAKNSWLSTNKVVTLQRHYKVHLSSQLRIRAQAVQTAVDSTQEQKLVEEVKHRLGKEFADLPLGRNGRDDEKLILWFLKDRKFDVDATTGKLSKFLTWHRDFGVEQITEESIKNISRTGKAYLHTSPDIHGRPVVVVVAAKHFPVEKEVVDSQKLCVYLVEKALQELPPGEEKILGIFDLRGFTVSNGDFGFVKFLIDMFFNYYPKRLGQVLFVDAPPIFQPGWNMVKPLLRSYASLVRFCSASTVREEYFTSETVPADFSDPKN